jgi:pyruvate formate lyase activating enzyme
MVIGGFAKNSMIDFPGNVACIVFTQGCNFLCPYCHNPDLVTRPQKGAGSLFNVETIFSFLSKRKGLLDGVVITGGEPTLQADLVAFCEQVRQMGFKIKLDTNGSRPGILEKLLKKDLLDYVAMDIKTSLSCYQLVTGSKKDANKVDDSIGLIMEKAPDHEFRTTCSRPFISPEILDDIGKRVSGAPRYILARCSRHVNVLDPDFIKSEAHFFSDKEMEELKAVIDPYVKTVTIR